MRIKIVAAMALSMIALVAAPVASAQAAGPTVRSAMKIEVDQSIVTSSVCTLGAVVSVSKAITAGHCGNVGQAVYNDRGVRIGTITANQVNRGLDIAVIRLARGVKVQVDSINWGGQFAKGQTVTKRGVTTGFSRGVINDPRPTMRTARGFSFAPPFLIEHRTVSVRARMFSQQGDSGSGIRSADGRIVGILSAGSSDNDTLIAPVSRLPAYLR